MNVRLRNFAIKLLPSTFIKAIRIFIEKNSKLQAFKGEYKSIEDVPIINEGYYNQEWINQTYLDTKDNLNSAKNSRFLPHSSLRNCINNLFPLLVSIYMVEKKSEVNIFDFGGGMGVSYIDCLSYLPKFNKIKFHVLDLKPTCELGRKIFNNNNNIIFHDDIPMDLKNINIVHLGSSLQYVEDYKGTLVKLISLGPEYIFLVDNFMGEMKTFATGQVNIRGKSIPYWIFNYEEIISLLENYGYEFIYKSPNYQPMHDLTNFPDEYSLRDSYNLLFARKENNLFDSV